MDTVKAELAQFRGLKDLKEFLRSPGPCVSVYLNLADAPANQSAKFDDLEWKQLIRTIAPKLEQHGAEGRELLASLKNWESIVPEAETQERAVGVFRSASAFFVTRLHEPVASRVTVGPHFFIRPLLPELTRPTSFYLLALSQKNTRLLHCTRSKSEEVALPPGTPESFDGFMNMDKPDHLSNDMSAAGPSAGHTKGVMAALNTLREDKPEFLNHFFHRIDQAINELLRDSSEPLVVAAVEKELAAYRAQNTYPHLAEEAVQGAPNSLKSGEMHARAFEALERSYMRKLDAVLAEYDHKVGGGASNRLKDVVTAAHDGRVVTLIVSESLETTGEFDEATHSVKARETGNGNDEDLVNDAVVQAILHAGQVYVAPNSKMPNGAPLAAVFRY